LQSISGKIEGKKESRKNKKYKDIKTKEFRE
jgi:hypothetical protein